MSEPEKIYIDPRGQGRWVSPEDGQPELGDVEYRRFDLPRPEDAARIRELEARAEAAEAAERELTLKMMALETEGDSLREALTPSVDTKADYSGKFSISVYNGEDEDGAELWHQVLIDWTDIKAIMVTIKARAYYRALTAPSETRGDAP